MNSGFERLLAQVRAASRIYLIGNGGSYANAMHLCNDLLGARLRAFCLDPSTLTAFANDYGYERAFAKWLQICAEKGDLLIALSGSGTSANILQAVAAAHAIGMTVHCIFGRERGENMQQAEEAQLAIGHALRKRLESERLESGHDCG